MPMKTASIAGLIAAVFVSGCQTQAPREIADQRLQDLPREVRQTAQMQLGGAEILDVYRLPHAEADVYQITYTSADQQPQELHVREDGMVVSRAEAMMGMSQITEAAGALRSGQARQPQRAPVATHVQPAPQGNQQPAYGLRLGTRFEDLPAPVQQTILQYAPGAEIADIDREDRAGRVVYEISFKHAGRNPKVHVRDDGQLLQSTQAESIRSEAAGAERQTDSQVISEEGAGAEVIQQPQSERSDALLSVPTRTGGQPQPLNGAQQPESIDEPAGAEARFGTLEPSMVRFSTLPASVQNAVRAHVGDTQIQEINRQVIYEVKFNGRTVLFRPDGTVVEQ